MDESEGEKSFKVNHYRRRYDGTLLASEKGEQIFDDLESAGKFAMGRNIYEGNGDTEEVTAILHVKKGIGWKMAEYYKKGILQK